jgi:hypothetical protein
VAHDEHYVVSPLGAWLIVALCSTLATGEIRDELADLLGAEPSQAAAFASELLQRPHPLVAFGAAVWNRPGSDSTPLDGWKRRLPATVETGDIPAQSDLDSWALRNSLGLIREFQIYVDRSVHLLLASVLATKVSWSQPFDLAPGSSLGPSSSWSSRLRQVLRTPQRARGHRQFIVDTEEAGTVAVHAASAEGGLLVCSVIADPGVPASSVLSAAHDIAIAQTTDSRDFERISLFDLPLGESSLWTITEESTYTSAPKGREERCHAILPAWSATSRLDLTDSTLGYTAAALAIKELLQSNNLRFEASQSTIARYNRTGFEAAAVTGFSALIGRPIDRPGIRRLAELRFGHPFASVAMATAERWDAVRSPAPGPWHGLPIFFAWVSEPTEAEEVLQREQL